MAEQIANFNKTKLDIKSLQALVHSKIESLGGYWKPLSGLARLVEELGEFALAIETGSKDQQRSELADLFIISTCLANQYCAQLDSAYAKLSLDPAPEPQLEGRVQLFKLIIAASELARRINHYDGDKPPKKSEQHINIEDLVAKLHLELCQIAHVLNIDFIDQVDKQLMVSQTRDNKRFDKTFDPSMSEHLYSLRIDPKRTFKLLEDSELYRYLFEDQISLDDTEDKQLMFDSYMHHIIVQNECKKLWGGLKWDETRNYKYNLMINRSQIIRFARISPFENLEGFILHIPQSIIAQLEYKKDLARFVEEIKNLGLIILLFDEKNEKGSHEVKFFIFNDLVYRKHAV